MRCSVVGYTRMSGTGMDENITLCNISIQSVYRFESYGAEKPDGRMT